MSVVSNIQNRITGVASSSRGISGGGTIQRRINVTGILGRQRGGSPPSVPPVNGARGGRQGRRLLSQPDSRMVEEARQEERARGGPPAPRNSLDFSVVTLDETVVINEEDNSREHLNLVFDTEEDNLGEERNSRDRRATPEINAYQEVVYDGVPPINPSRRAVSDFHDNIEVAIVDTTIDLTDSPPRIFPPLPSETRQRPSTRPLPSHAPTDSPPRIFPAPRFTRPSRAPQDLLTTDSPPRMFPPLSSEALHRPSNSLPSRELTDSLSRLLPAPRFSRSPRPRGTPQDLLTRFPIRPMTPQRPICRTFLRPRFNRIVLPDPPPSSTRSLCPQPSSPRLSSPQPSNNDCSYLPQPDTPSASLKCPVCMETFLSIRRRGNCGSVLVKDFWTPTPPSKMNVSNTAFWSNCLGTHPTVRSC